MLKTTFCFLFMSATLLSAATPIAVHGHRGARAMRPENTIPSYKYTAEVGADAIEMDTQVTKDNVLVIHHDPRFNPTTCTGEEGRPPIRELTFEAVRKWDCGSKLLKEFPKQVAQPGTKVPTFDEVLDLAKTTKLFFNVEVKSSPKQPTWQPEPAEYVRMVVDTVRKHKLQKRVLIQSFDWRITQETAKYAPELLRSALDDKGVKDFIGTAEEAKTQWVSPHYKLVTPEKVAAAHKAGIKIAAWTANTPEIWEKLVEAGVDVIITDDPAELLAFLRKKGLHK